MTGAAKLSVRELGPADDDVWTEFVRSSTSGSAYAQRAYVEALCEAAGGTCAVLVAHRGDALAGGIALYERSSTVGRDVSPRLLLYYNGFVLRDYETRYPSERASREVEAIGALATELGARGYDRLELRSRSPVADVRALLAQGWRVEPSYSYVVDVSDPETLWKRVESNLRRLVERGRANGLALVVDEDFDAFYELHAETHARKGAPLYLERDAFRRYYARLSKERLCHLFHARLPDGRVAASQLVLVGHPVTHTVCAGAAAELQQTGASPFLRWHVFEWLAANGYEANDLTDATLGSVSRFKSQLGASLTMSLVASRPVSARFRTLDSSRRALGRARRGISRS